MMCAIRRQYSGEVKYCWPISCCPEVTSHRRNSAFSRPSPWRVMRPVTSAWALMVFQFWNCGAWSMLEIFSMKAAWSTGANSPERLRLLVMTWVTPTPTSPSDGVPATKFGIAMGIACVPPGTTSSRGWPCAAKRPGRASPANASAPPANVKARRDIGSDRPGAGSPRSNLVMLVSLVMKHEGQRLPFGIPRLRQHLERLTADDGPASPFENAALTRAARFDLDQGRRGERAVDLEGQRDRNLDLFFVEPSGVALPAVVNLADQRGEIARRQRCRRPLGGADCRVRIQRFPGKRLPGRIALVDQGGDGFG